MGRVAVLLAGLLAVLMGGRARADEFTWLQGQAPVAMHPEDTHWCFLTHVQGSFRGWGERVSVKVVDGGWVLSGTSGQDGVGARANCVELSRFKVPPGSVHWVSAPFFRQFGSGKKCAVSTIQSWQGDAITAISEFGGAYEGGGEYLYVVQSQDPTKPTTSTLRTCQAQTLGAVTSYFFGVPHTGQKLAFIGPVASYVSLNEDKVYSAWAGIGTMSLLPSVDEAVCYLTRISGGFHGGAESVSLWVQANGHWALRVDRKSGDGVVVYAKCAQLDQRGQEALGTKQQG